MKGALGGGREGVRATQRSSVRRMEAWLRISNVGPLGTRTEAWRASDGPGLRVRGGTGVFEGPRGGPRVAGRGMAASVGGTQEVG